MRRSIAMILGMILLCTVTASGATVPASVWANQTAVQDAVRIDGVTYVPFRSFCLWAGAEEITWDGDTAWATGLGTVSAGRGDYYVVANGRYLFTGEQSPVRVMEGRTMVPLRALARAYQLTVTWNSGEQAAYVAGTPSELSSGETYYDADDLYWLSRIISAESRGESLMGQIAVGTVILNRVESTEFPDTIYDVIFDRENGVQFTPTSNGTIYDSPAECSVIAAKLCLDGARVAGDSLYFLNPALAQSTWIVENCEWVAAIGNHAFYA